jgi:drug/metabolite transporter (DMT)-like permease
VRAIAEIEERRDRGALVALAIAVAAISFAAIFFRKAAPTHPLVMAGVRLAIAALILAPFTVRGLRRGKLPKPVLISAVLGGLAYAAHFGTWVTSLTLTTVAASVTLVTATPLLLAVIALATGRDRPDAKHFASIALAIVGLFFIGGADFGSADALVGDALAFAGAAAMAGYMLLVRRHGATLDVWAFSGVTTAVGSLALLATAAGTGVPIEIPSVEAGIFVALAALVPQLIGHTCLTWALRHTRPTVVGIATVGEPVGSTVLAALWLGEQAGPTTLVGCAIVLAAVVVAVFEPRSRRPVSRP